MSIRLYPLNQSKETLIRRVAFGLMMLSLVTLPFYVTGAYVLHTIVLVLIYIPLALSQNLITGFTGMLTLGQAAFYGLGAYTSALLVMRLGAPWPVAFIASGFVALLFGVLISFPCLRVGSDYLTLMTIGFGEIFRVIATNWMEVTRGSQGLPAVPPPSISSFVFNTLERQYYLYLVIVIICYLFMYRLTRSHIGRTLIAIREDDIAASTLGINLARYKVLAFAFGALWAGYAGSMLAHFLMFVGPQSFTLDESLLHMQMAILGGFGSLPGSVLGAAIMVSIPELFQDFYKYRMLINGVLLLMLMAWRPQGILGTSAVARTASEGFFKKMMSRFFREKLVEEEDSSVPHSPSK